MYINPYFHFLLSYYRILFVVADEDEEREMIAWMTSDEDIVPVIHAPPECTDDEKIAKLPKKYINQKSRANKKESNTTDFFSKASIDVSSQAS